MEMQSFIAIITGVTTGFTYKFGYPLCGAHVSVIVGCPGDLFKRKRDRRYDN
jgi:hypothetical protein